MVDDPDDTEAPHESKSARKRAAHAAQDLGTRLIALSPTDLERLGLPDALHDAVVEARRLTSRAALARQRQYIGKLMRQLDTAAIEVALAARHATGAKEAARQQYIERWRTRLLAEGEPAIESLLAVHRPAGMDPQAHERLAALVATARSERSAPAVRSGAARSLFRELRALLAAD